MSEIFRMGMSSNFFFSIGDCGNNNTAAWTLQSAISYQARASSFTQSTGTVIMPYSWNSSDERIKANAKTIEYALDKYYHKYWCIN